MFSSLHMHAQLSSCCAFILIVNIFLYLYSNSVLLAFDVIMTRHRSLGGVACGCVGGEREIIMEKVGRREGGRRKQGHNY